VKRILVGLLLLSGLGGIASAQMDPRNASGTPRPDESVPVGTLTVLILQGEMTKPVAGQTVTLVAVKPDGTLSAEREVTDASGHVVYSGLKTDGQTVYYAFCLLGGDRLESDSIIPDGTSGMKMLLSGRKDGGAAIDDDRQGDEVPPVPGGQLYVVLRGHLPAKLPLELREIGSDRVVGTIDATPAMAPPKDKDKDPDQGVDKLIGVFDGLPAGPDHIYYAQTNVGGKTFRTHPAMLSDANGSTRGVLVVSQLLFSMQGGAELDDDRLGFQLQLNLLNGTGMPVPLGPDGLIIPLPSGFRSANAKDEQFGDRVSIVPDKGVKIRGTIPPGSHSTIVSFLLPESNGTVDFDMPMPLGIYESQVAIEKAAGAQIDTRGTLPPPRVSKMDDGRNFYVVGNLEMQPGQVVSFRVTGLPEPSQAQAIARVLAGLFVLGFIVWILVVVLGPAPVVVAAPASDQRKALEARRDRMYDQLIAMERRRPFRVDEDARSELVRRLAVVLRELDGGGGTTGAAPSSPSSKKAKRAS
jgi:hypothetical protein